MQNPPYITIASILTPVCIRVLHLQYAWVRTSSNSDPNACPDYGETALCNDAFTDRRGEPEVLQILHNSRSIYSRGHWVPEVTGNEEVHVKVCPPRRLSHNRRSKSGSPSGLRAV